MASVVILWRQRCLSSVLLRFKDGDHLSCLKKKQTLFKRINLIIKNKTIDQLISDGLPHPQEDNVFGSRQKTAGIVGL